MNKATFREGDEIVSVRTDGLYKGGFNAHRPKLYEAIARQKDGAVIWQMVMKLGDRWRTREAAVRQAQKIAQEMNIPFLDDIRHGDPLDKANS